MAPCQLSRLIGNTLNPFNVLMLRQPDDVLPKEFHLDVDFSDVFGPLPTQAPDAKKLVYDDFSDVFGPLPTQAPDAKKLVYDDDPDLTHSPREKLEKLSLESTVVNKAIGLEDFEVLKVVGEGGFAKVYQVRKIGSSDIYAMKVIRKDMIVEENLADDMKSERDILTKIDHPFIVNLRYCFQTKYRLYLVLDFVNGGDLSFQLHRQCLFREDLARIYAAEIVSAVSYLHAKGILHRDLKPGNILLDAGGHAMLTDFGLAKQFANQNCARSNSICGTWAYMAPEVVLGEYHDKAADWWSVGIMLYEMLSGNRPFTGKRNKVQRKILNDKIKLPSFLSSDAHSLLKGLLHKDPSKRLGSGSRGSERIKGHKWFRSINWNKLEAREIQPSFVPQVAGKQCIANFEERHTNMPVIDSPPASPRCSENTFQGFSYVRPAAV